MKTMAAALLAAGISVSAAQAATDGGGGNLTITGSIIQPPCSIDPGSVDQQVELGAVSSSTINGGKIGRKTPFEIKLLDCDAPSTVRVSIWGTEDSLDKTLLHLGSGTAKGAGIAFFDSTANQIKLGENSRDIQVPTGNFTLSLAAALKGNAANSVAEPGDFTSTATFKLEYN
ncbi:fimbrial protein [Serratia ficaria]|uniref:fimbrial protein n=1 Tax=Serratia ficaria TaxID=61651 RepID=UPI0021BCFF0B|nr:fimbrial protein [Serratia ficaria]